MASVPKRNAVGFVGLLSARIPHNSFGGWTIRSTPGTDVIGYLLPTGVGYLGRLEEMLFGVWKCWESLLRPFHSANSWFIPFARSSAWLQSVFLSSIKGGGLSLKDGWVTRMSSSSPGDSSSGNWTGMLQPTRRAAKNGAATFGERYLTGCSSGFRSVWVSPEPWWSRGYPAFGFYCE